MAGSVNKVTLVGNLARDPEIRNLNQEGAQVASMRLLTSETWTDKASGERKERTEGHDIVVFNESLIRVVRDYCKKGMKLYIEGSLQTRKWQDKDGNDRYSTEIVLQRYRGELVMLSRADDDGYNSRGGEGGGERSGGSGGSGGGARSGGGDNRGGGGNDRGGSRSGGGDNRGGGNDRGRGGFDAEMDDDVPF